MGVWKQVTQQVGNLAKHVAKAVVHEPVEIVKDAVGASDQSGENQAMHAMEQGMQGQQQQTGDDSNNPKGFQTIQDYQKYQQLSGKKDEMEMAVLRKRLHQEYGLSTDLEQGMQRARMEREQKNQQEEQVEEQKKQQEDWMQEQKKKEDMSVAAAKGQASAEKQAWGAG